MAKRSAPRIQTNERNGEIGAAGAHIHPHIKNAEGKGETITAESNNSRLQIPSIRFKDPNHARSLHNFHRSEGGEGSFMIGKNNNSKQIENFGSSYKLAGDAEMEDKCPLFPSLFIFPWRSASFWSVLQETDDGAAALMSDAVR